MHSLVRVVIFGMGALSLALSGCSPCTPSRCISEGAVVIHVFDAATGAGIVDATVLSSSGGSDQTAAPHCPNDVAPDGGPTNCWAIQNPGSYHVVVRAQGYADANLDVTASKDACGNVPSQLRDVKLQPTGTSTQALVSSSQGCGG